MLLDLILNVEHLEYKTKLTYEELKKILDKIFNPWAFNSKYFVTGDFKNKYQFKVADNSIILPISFEEYPAYIKGEIKETDNGSILNLRIRPNISDQIIPFISLFSGLFIIFVDDFEDRYIVFAVCILFGIFAYVFGFLARKKLKKKFERYLDIKNIC